MFGDIFDGEIAKERRDYSYGPYSVSLVCVPKENQHIDKWVPLVVWRGAEAFNDELIKPERKSALEGRKLIELGSGTGLCGLLAAKICRNTTVLTDGSEDSVEALEESIGLNSFDEAKQNVVAKLLMWGDKEAARRISELYGPFEVCIATDVIYEAAAVGPLLTSAYELLAPGGIFYFANHRFRFHGLADELKKHLNIIPLKLVELTRTGEDVDLYVLSK